MHDFPPPVPDMAGPDARAHTTPTRRGRGWCRRLPRRDFSSPQTRSVRFLGWLLWQQLPLLLLSSLLSVIEWLPGSVGPYLVGKIVDEGIIPGDLATVGRLSLIMFGLVVIGIIASVLGHTLVVRTWLVAMYGSMKLVTRKATQMGHVLPQRTPTGEVLSVSASDSDEFGALTEIVSRFVGALIAYLVIAGLVLSTSVARHRCAAHGTVDRVVRDAAAPAAAAPRRDRPHQDIGSDLDGNRHRGRAADPARYRRRKDLRPQLRRAVATHTAGCGLSWCLAGCRRGNRRAVVRSVPGCLDLARPGKSWPETSKVGQLISFFGYAIFMVWPIQTFFELAQKWVRSVVSARKTVAVLDQQPPWQAPWQPLTLPDHAVLHDHIGVRR